MRTSYIAFLSFFAMATSAFAAPFDYKYEDIAFRVSGYGNIGMIEPDFTLNNSRFLGDWSLRGQMTYDADNVHRFGFVYSLDQQTVEGDEYINDLFALWQVKGLGRLEFGLTDSVAEKLGLGLPDVGGLRMNNNPLIYKRIIPTGPVIADTILNTEDNAPRINVVSVSDSGTQYGLSIAGGRPDYNFTLDGGIKMRMPNGKTQKAKSKKTVKPANPAAVRATPKQKTYNPWSMSIYVYWFIILFFIAATFYILGRSHGVLNHRVPLNNNTAITEEMFLNASDYYESGKTKLLSGNIEDAIADLTTAIDAGAPTADMYILRGEAFMQSANYRGALDDFNAALEINPQSSVAYYDRALLNTRLEDYNAALNDINNALAVRATNDQDILQLRDLYAKRGQLNLWLKNWDGAIADYTNSLARPDGIVNPSVYAERAEAYTALGDYAAAINDYSSAVRIIAEQIQGAASSAERESMSANAMSYFEKSAALNLQIGNIDAARSDLDSARTIAMALNDVDSVDRLDALLNEINY